MLLLHQDLKKPLVHKSGVKPLGAVETKITCGFELVRWGAESAGIPQDLEKPGNIKHKVHHSLETVEAGRAFSQDLF